MSRFANVDQYYNAEEVGKRLAKSAKTIIRLITSGQMTGAKVGGGWSIPESGIVEYLDRRTLKAKPRKTA